MKLYGLIGHPLDHSFSEQYFSEKFYKEGIEAEYHNFDLEYLTKLTEVLKKTNLGGLNVTIPYKEEVMTYLDSIDELALEVGSVNTIKFTDTGSVGYNTDVIGFEQSLSSFLKDAKPNALIFGTGGSSKAVRYVLSKLGLDYQLVSRTKTKETITYEEVDKELLKKHYLLINASPVGMFPNINEAVNIPYDCIGEHHFCFDLIYNPNRTKFLREASQRGAEVKNGNEMLIRQAEASWQIWNSLSE